MCADAGSQPVDAYKRFLAKLKRLGGRMFQGFKSRHDRPPDADSKRGRDAWTRGNTHEIAALLDLNPPVHALAFRRHRFGDFSQQTKERRQRPLKTLGRDHAPGDLKRQVSLNVSPCRQTLNPPARGFYSRLDSPG